MKRREFLTVPAAAIGGTLLYTLAGEPMRLQAQTGAVKVPLRFFTAEEARVVSAACARIFPTDASGPGAFAIAPGMSAGMSAGMSPGMSPPVPLAPRS